MCHPNPLYQAAAQADLEYQDAVYANNLHAQNPENLRKLKAKRDELTAQWLNALRSFK